MDPLNFVNFVNLFSLDTDKMNSYADISNGANA